MPAMRQHPMLVLLFGTVACKPACPEYWEKACEVCGGDSRACTNAKEIGKTLESKPNECSATATKLSEKIESEVFARRYCNAMDESPGDLASLSEASWICDGVRVEFGEGIFSVDEQAHDLTALTVSSFQLTSGPAYHRRTDDGALVCKYDLGEQDWSGGEVALALDCPAGLGLPTGWESCLRER